MLIPEHAFLDNPVLSVRCVRPTCALQPPFDQVRIQYCDNVQRVQKKKSQYLVESDSERTTSHQTRKCCSAAPCFRRWLAFRATGPSTPIVHSPSGNDAKHIGKIEGEATRHRCDGCKWSVAHTRISGCSGWSCICAAQADVCRRYHSKSVVGRQRALC